MKDLSLILTAFEELSGHVVASEKSKPLFHPLKNLCAEKNSGLREDKPSLCVDVKLHEKNAPSFSQNQFQVEAIIHEST